jgi:hypothetical protein
MSISPHLVAAKVAASGGCARMTRLRTDCHKLSIYQSERVRQAQGCVQAQVIIR